MAAIRRKQPEQEFHKTVARFLDAALPPSCWWTTFPAGGGGKARGGKLKAMGLKPGVADILILQARAGGFLHAIWIELKVPKGKGQSKPQLAFAQAMADLSRAVTIHVCRTLEQVEAALRASYIPLRARVMAGGAWAKEAA